jgi:hypothetical protein
VPSIKQLSLILFLGLISVSIEATTLNFNYANNSTQVIAGVKLIQTESDGVITIYASNASGEITLPTTSNTYTLSASLAETGEDPISLIDAIQILQYGGELRELTEDQKTAADVNQDGEVDVLDAIWILQHLGELRTLDGGLIFLDANTGKPLAETTFSADDTPSISVVRLGDVDGDFDPSLITDHAPILTGTTTININENEVDISTLVASDADGDALTYEITGGADQDLFTINASTGILSFKAGPDYEDPSDSGGDNLYDVEISVSDGINTTTQALVVSVGDLNDRGPVILNLASSVSVTENQTSVITISASDADNDTLTYTLSGTDASSFSINSSSGVITFNSAPDYETKSSYSITLTVSDGSNTATQALTINITNVNDVAPIFTSLPSVLLVAENKILVYQIKAIEVESDTISYSLSGTDASQFNVSSSGLISLKTARDYENLSNNRFNITVTISDGSLTKSRNTIVMITDVVENLIGESTFGSALLE